MQDNSSDKRAKLLSLTDTGENYAKSIIAPLLEIENNTAQSFGIERLEKLIDEFAILERLFNEQMNTFINRINQ